MAKRPATPATQADPPPIVAQDPVPAPAPVEPAAAVEPVAAAPAVEPDEFSEMFAQFAQEADPSAPKPPEPVAAAPAVVEPGAPAAAAVEPAAPAPAPAAAPQDPIERLADILAQRREPPPAPTPANPQPAPVPAFNAEETQALQAFYQEWPEIARAQELAMRMAVQQTTDYVFRSIATYLKPKFELLDQLASNVQWDQLERRIPGYATIEDKIASWVDSQPDYLKTAYGSVMSEGTPDQVEDLVRRYRQETGDAAPAQTIAPSGGGAPNPQSPARQPAELSPAAKKAVAALAPVTSKRTTPTQSEPAGFDDAFDRFAADMAAAPH